jgi:hypothetical protein
MPWYLAERDGPVSGNAVFLALVEKTLFTLLEWPGTIRNTLASETWKSNALE